jgi:F-type H+-transporting ATPase subunit delta
MQNPRLAARYAKSLLDLAIEKNVLDATLQDMQTLEQVCKQSREFVVMLRSPVIKPDMKSAALNAVIGDKLQPLSKAFTTLLVSKGRESTLPEIATAFIQQYKDLKKIRTIRLTTAMPVNDSVKEAIRSKVAGNMVDHTVEMETLVDPALIGGFTLEIGDKLVDASVRRDLNDIKKQFLDKSYVMQLR